MTAAALRPGWFGRWSGLSLSVRILAGLALGVFIGLFFGEGAAALQPVADMVRGGEETDVTLELDVEPRTVEIPQDLETALMTAGALEAFDRSAPSMKKEYVRQVVEAKAQETRQRRIAKIVDKLRAGK